MRISGGGGAFPHGCSPICKEMMKDCRYWEEGKNEVIGRISGQVQWCTNHKSDLQSEGMTPAAICLSGDRLVLGMGKMRGSMGSIGSIGSIRSSVHPKNPLGANPGTNA